MVMDALRDQSVTTHGTAPFQAQAAAPEAGLPMRAPKRCKDGKPAAIIFKRYRHPTTEDVATEWFPALPKEGWPLDGGA